MSDDRLIWDLWLSVHQLPAMTAADELGIFEALDATPTDSAGLATRLKLDPRGVEVLLTLLAAMKLTIPREGRHQLSPTARTYLLRSSPTYWGPLLRGLGSHPAHGKLIETLRPVQSEQKTASAKPWAGGADDWAAGQISPARARRVAEVMHCHSLAAAAAAARSPVLRGTSRLLDVGGGSGCFSIAFALQHPELRCTILELPAMCDVALEYVTASGVRDRVSAESRDMFRSDWPTGYDAIFLSNVFHDWAPETNRDLAARAFAALPSGGRILLHEMLIDDDGGGPVTTASFSMLMLLSNPGRQYRDAELKQLLEGVGFSDVGVTQTTSYYSIVQGTKR